MQHDERGTGENLADMLRTGSAILTFVDDRRRLGQLTGQSPATYGSALWLFARFVGVETEVRRITRRHVERWLLSMNVSDATRRVRLTAVRSYAKWAVAHGAIRHDFTAGIDPPRQPRQVPPRALATELVAVVLAACPDLRSELMASLMVQEGLRCCEVAWLQLGDIDQRKRTMLVKGKGGHQRVLPITDATWRVLTRYLAEHPAKAGPLIRSYRDEHIGISPQRVSQLVCGVMHDAGITETAHAMRHTSASDMLDRGAHVRTVQYALGHSSLQSTQRYLRWQVGSLREAMGGRDYRRTT